ncbi:hypothetical protein Tco_1254329 [Tanacetum coccineum]
MRRPTKGSPGVITPLFATMLAQPQEDHVSPPNESPLHAVHSHESDEGSLKLHELTNLVTQLSDRIVVLEADLKTTKHTYSFAFTKLILKVKKLEKHVKTGKARRKVRIVLSEDEDVQDDSSKQGRMLSDDQEEGVEWILNVETEVQDKEVQDKASTASDVPIVSTTEVDVSTAGRVVYSRRSSRETRQDKGKAILTEPEPKKKSKKELELERLSLPEAIRIQEQIDEEKRAQIARDEEIAKQWQE